MIYNLVHCTCSVSTGVAPGVSTTCSVHGWPGRLGRGFRGTQ